MDEDQGVRVGFGTFGRWVPVGPDYEVLVRGNDRPTVFHYRPTGSGWLGEEVTVDRRSHSQPTTTWASTTGPFEMRQREGDDPGTLWVRVKAPAPDQPARQD